MKRVKKRDLILIAILLAVALACILIFRLSGKTSGDACLVQVEGEDYGRYPLDQDQTIEIKNSDGQVTNVLIIKDGICDMTEATCPDKLCVKQKKIRYDGESIICLPNQVVATIESDEKADLDTLAQ